MGCGGLGWSGSGFESPCDFGIELSGSIKCWKTIEWRNNCCLSSSAQLDIVRYLVMYLS
jgi:hypothetical protein